MKVGVYYFSALLLLLAAAGGWVLDLDLGLVRALAMAAGVFFLSGVVAPWFGIGGPKR